MAVFASGGNVWHQPGSAFEKILRGEKLSLHEHLSLDDSDFFYHIKQWRHAEDRILADLAGRFLDRRLFKAFDLDMPDDETQNFLDQAQKLVADAGFDPEYYFVEDKGGDVPHYFYTKDDTRPKDQIFVEVGFSRPEIREISEVSAAVRGLQQGYRIHRVCFPGEAAGEVSAIYHRGGSA